MSLGNKTVSSKNGGNGALQDFTCNPTTCLLSLHTHSVMFFSLMSLQDCLSGQDSVQESLQQLHALGEQLRNQVDASSSASLQFDYLSLTHRLATLKHALHRQQELLQVGQLGLLLCTCKCIFSLNINAPQFIRKDEYIIHHLSFHSVFSLVLRPVRDSESSWTH